MRDAGNPRRWMPLNFGAEQGDTPVDARSLAWLTLAKNQKGENGDVQRSNQARGARSRHRDGRNARMARTTQIRAQEIHMRSKWRSCRDLCRVRQRWRSACFRTALRYS